MLYTNYSSNVLSVQSPVYCTLEQFLYFYLSKRDFESALACVSENIFSIGTHDESVAIGKDELSALLKDETEKFPHSIPFEIYDYCESQSHPDCWSCFCNVKFTVAAPDSTPVLYHTRLTATLHKECNRYLIDCFHISQSQLYQAETKCSSVRFVSNEVTKLHRQAQQDLLQLIDQMMPGGIMGGYVEDGFPLYIVNERFLCMAGYTHDQFLQDTNGLVINSVHEDDRKMVCEKITQVLSQSNQYELEYRMKKSDGTFFWVHSIGKKTVTAEGREAIVSVLMDVTEQIENRQYLWDVSVRDSLTGVYNRNGYSVNIAKYLTSHSSFVFLMLDLDHFKRLNDIYGHLEGDFALQYIAKLLTDSFRKTDIVCRLGGDEFSVFIVNCPEVAVIEEKVHRIIQLFSSVMEQKYPESGCSVSFGGVYGQGITTFEKLYQAADKVLYEVKNSGRGTYKFRALE